MNKPLSIRVCIGLIIWLGLASTGIAESTDTAIPQPPFLRPQERASWMMTVVPGVTQNAAGKTKELVQQEVTLTGKIKHEINTWSDGQKSEIWIVNGILLVEDPRKHFLTLIDPSRDPAAAYYLRYEFTQLSWLSPKTYVRAETHNGVPCYWFKKGSQNNLAADPSIDSETVFDGPSAEAWINAATRQLVSVKVGTTLYNFTYGAPPDSDLVLPPKFAALWQGYLEAINPLNVQQPPSH
jgi:hypothetical protein